MTNIDLPLALSYDDVLLVPQYSEIDSRSDVDLSTKLAPNVKLKIPLVTTKMDTITGVEMAIKMGELGGLGILPRFEPIEDQVDKVRKVKEKTNLVAAAIGVKKLELERAEALVSAGANIIDVDVAHGHMKKTIDIVTALKNQFNGQIMIIAGITSTEECADDLYKAGADCLLVGIGAGSICTTRIQTGVGVPGFQSLLETAKSAAKYKKTYMPDAGVRNSGDIVKALATGASTICAGSLFAGTDETPGDIIEIDGKKYKRYNGSASEEEKNKQFIKDNNGKTSMYTKHIEGVEAMVPYRGPVKEVIIRLLAGVRSGFSYCGAKNIQELWQNAKFIQITSGGVRENDAHDVIALKKQH